MTSVFILGIAFSFTFCFVALLSYGLLGRRAAIGNQIQDYLLNNAQRIFMLTTILMSLVVGIAFTICTAIDFADFAFASVVSTLPFVAAILFALIAFKRRYPIPRKVFVTFSLFLALSIVQGGAALCLGWNQYGDESAAQRHILPVIYKRTSGVSNDNYFHLVVPSWRNAENITIIPVDRTVYQNADPGVHYLEVITKPGRMGYEWIVSKRLTQ